MLITGASTKLQQCAQMDYNSHVGSDDHFSDICLICLQHSNITHVAAIWRLTGGNGAGDESVRAGIQFWPVGVWAIV